MESIKTRGGYGSEVKRKGLATFDADEVLEVGGIVEYGRRIGRD
jgi:hypothetical protein